MVDAFWCGNLLSFSISSNAFANDANIKHSESTMLSVWILSLGRIPVVLSTTWVDSFWEPSLRTSLIIAKSERRSSFFLLALVASSEIWSISSFLEAMVSSSIAISNFLSSRISAFFFSSSARNCKKEAWRSFCCFISSSYLFFPFRATYHALLLFCLIHVCIVQKCR